MYYSIIKKILFCFDPEVSHTLALVLLKWAHRLRLISFFSMRFSSPCQVMGLTFSNYIGISAGLDKNGEYIDALGALGFGFIEVGTVTPKPQPGNAKPRLFRLPEQEALINRMGFNNKGVDYLVQQLQRTRYQGIIGVNIGKNQQTPLERAVDDYCEGFNKVARYASYVVLNVSSPNTLGLRALQQREYLQILLRHLKKAQALFLKNQHKYVPLVLKISPDLTTHDIAEIAEVLLTEKIDGVIAANTTTQHEGPSGGLSGKPLFKRTIILIQQLQLHLQSAIPIIASGGIFSKEDAKACLLAGASLVQVYTGLVYKGPFLDIKNSKEMQ